MSEGFHSEIREADGSLDATARIVDAGGSDDERLVEAALPGASFWPVLFGVGLGWRF